MIVRDGHPIFYQTDVESLSLLVFGAQTFHSQEWICGVSYAKAFEGKFENRLQTIQVKIEVMCL